MAKAKKSGKPRAKKANKTILKSILFPPELEERIKQDAIKERRSFNAQVLHLVDLALEEMKKEKGERDE